MDNGLGMHHWHDILRINIKKIGGLNEFQALIHERGGIDRHHRTHIPRGVVKRLGGGHSREVGTLLAPERATRGGENDTAYLAVPV